MTKLCHIKCVHAVCISADSGHFELLLRLKIAGVLTSPRFMFVLLLYVGMAGGKRISEYFKVSVKIFNCSCCLYQAVVLLCL